MIFYFSGTGNSKWVAKQIAELTFDKAYNIMEFEEIPNIKDEKQIGFIFPIYAWGAPEPVLNFAKKLENINIFTFGICTCGEEAGLAMKRFSKIYHLDSSYSLIMPNNYIIGTDIDEDRIINNKINNAYNKIKTISTDILNKNKVYDIEEGKFSKLKSTIFNFGFNKFARTTRKFYVIDKCNGCGLCVKNCMISAIQLIDKKPIWNKKLCYQCLRCINECPKQAIQYGKATENRNRYMINRYI